MDMNNKSIIAITGPSGVGKTTLGNKIITNNEIVIPYHCTTRKRRNDDVDGFYKYLSHEEYSKLFHLRRFLISYGDSNIISVENGNFYGVLKEDCIQSWQNNDIILLFVSYKDIYTLIDLKNKGLTIDIINLRFHDIKNGVTNRLSNDILRNHTIEEINKRVYSALNDNNQYGSIVDKYAKCTIYTDINNEEETYTEVCDKLKIKIRR